MSASSISVCKRDWFISVCVARPRTSIVDSSWSLSVVLWDYSAFRRGSCSPTKLRHWSIKCVVCVWLRATPFRIRPFGSLCRILIADTVHPASKNSTSLSKLNSGSQSAIFSRKWWEIKCLLAISAIFVQAAVRLSVVATICTSHPTSGIQSSLIALNGCGHVR